MNYSLTPKHQHGLKILSTWLLELYDKDISVILGSNIQIPIVDSLDLINFVVDDGEYTKENGRLLNQIRWFYYNRTELQYLGFHQKD